MKYSKNPEYKNNNYTYVILKNMFNIKDSNTLVVNLYDGNTKIRINDNIIEVYEESAYEGSGYYSIQINQDYIYVDPDLEWSQEYLKALIYNSRDFSFHVLCDSCSNLQLFYSKLTESLLNRLSRYARRYSDYGDKSELCLVGDHFWLSISLKYSFKPRIEINGLSYSLLSDDFINIIEELV